MSQKKPSPKSSPNNSPKPKSDPDHIRLNKLLSQYGFASRRTADEWISQGRISINGKVVRELGTKVHITERKIELDGVPLEPEKQKLEYFLFYKPPSVITSLKDPEGRECVGDFLLEFESRLFPVGRLDYDAEGLLLITNDGELANIMQHPRYNKKKTYLVKVKGQPENQDVAKLTRGIRLEDGMAKAVSVKFMKKTMKNIWFEMTLNEGRNHQIKRMWAAIGNPVLKIIRTKFGPFKVGDLKPGVLRTLNDEEKKMLERMKEEA